MLLTKLPGSICCNGMAPTGKVEAKSMAGKSDAKIKNRFFHFIVFSFIKRRLQTRRNRGSNCVKLGIRDDACLDRQNCVLLKIIYTFCKDIWMGDVPINTPYQVSKRYLNENKVKK